MFTGITTDIGIVAEVERRQDLRAKITCHWPTDDIALGASIACSGVCLTVVEKGEDWFAVDVSEETLARTAAHHWEQGAALNLERSARLGDELGGHIVTGHVDATGTVVQTNPVAGSRQLVIAVPRAIAKFIAEKGSITINGVSLTVNDVQDFEDRSEFSLNIVPHTAEVTTLGSLEVDAAVNIEIDILARYLARMQAASEA